MTLKDGSGRVRQTSLYHPNYKLSSTDRQILGLMSAMGRWSRTTLAEGFGVTRKTVLVCERRYISEHGGKAIPYEQPDWNRDYYGRFS